MSASLATTATPSPQHPYLVPPRLPETARQLQAVPGFRASAIAPSLQPQQPAQPGKQQQEQKQQQHQNEVPSLLLEVSSTHDYHGRPPTPFALCTPPAACLADAARMLTPSPSWSSQLSLAGSAPSLGWCSARYAKQQCLVQMVAWVAVLKTLTFALGEQGQADPAEVTSLQIMAHHFKIPSRIDFWCAIAPPSGGVGAETAPTSLDSIRAVVVQGGASAGRRLPVDPAAWTHLGHILLSSNTASNFRAREVKTVPVAFRATHVRLALAENHANELNLWNQAALVQVRFFGPATLQTPLPGTGAFANGPVEAAAAGAAHSQLPAAERSAYALPPSLASVDAMVPATRGLPEVFVHGYTALNAFARDKADAVAAEDYMRAADLKRRCDRILDTLRTMETCLRHLPEEAEAGGEVASAGTTQPRLWHTRLNEAQSELARLLDARIPCVVSAVAASEPSAAAAQTKLPKPPISSPARRSKSPTRQILDGTAHDDVPHAAGGAAAPPSAPSPPEAPASPEKPNHPILQRSGSPPVPAVLKSLESLNNTPVVSPARSPTLDDTEAKKTQLAGVSMPNLSAKGGATSTSPQKKRGGKTSPTPATTSPGKQPPAASSPGKKSPSGAAGAGPHLIPLTDDQRVDYRLCIDFVGEDIMTRFLARDFETKEAGSRAIMDHLRGMPADASAATLQTAIKGAFSLVDKTLSDPREKVACWAISLWRALADHPQLARSPTASQAGGSDAITPAGGSLARAISPAAGGNADQPAAAASLHLFLNMSLHHWALLLNRAGEPNARLARAARSCAEHLLCSYPTSLVPATMKTLMHGSSAAGNTLSGGAAPAAASAAAGGLPWRQLRARIDVLTAAVPVLGVATRRHGEDSGTGVGSRRGSASHLDSPGSRFASLQRSRTPEVVDGAIGGVPARGSGVKSPTLRRPASVLLPRGLSVGAGIGDGASSAVHDGGRRLDLRELKSIIVGHLSHPHHEVREAATGLLLAVATEVGPQAVASCLEGLSQRSQLHTLKARLERVPRPSGTQQQGTPSSNVDSPRLVTRPLITSPLASPTFSRKQLPAGSSSDDERENHTHRQTRATNEISKAAASTQQVPAKGPVKPEEKSPKKAKEPSSRKENEDGTKADAAASAEPVSPKKVRAAAGAEQGPPSNSTLPQPFASQKRAAPPSHIAVPGPEAKIDSKSRKQSEPNSAGPGNVSSPQSSGDAASPPAGGEAPLRRRLSNTGIPTLKRAAQNLIGSSSPSMLARAGFPGVGLGSKSSSSSIKADAAGPLSPKQQTVTLPAEEGNRPSSGSSSSVKAKGSSRQGAAAFLKKSANALSSSKQASAAGGKKGGLWDRLFGHSKDGSGKEKYGKSKASKSAEDTSSGSGLRARLGSAGSLLAPRTSAPELVSEQPPASSVTMPRDDGRDQEVGAPLRQARSADTEGAPESTDNDWNIDMACVFCDEQNPEFNESRLDVHYWKECPMLTECPHCKTIVEVVGMNDHYRSECRAETRPRTPIEMPPVGACPLCSAPVGAGEQAMRKHLLTGHGCPKSHRPPRPGVAYRI